MSKPLFTHIVLILERENGTKDKLLNPSSNWLLEFFCKSSKVVKVSRKEIPVYPKERF